jgi:hypothetical protein
MITILGFARSGTTLLSRCLNQHPEISIFYETNLLVPMAFNISYTSRAEEGRELLFMSIVSNDRYQDTIGQVLSEAGLRRVIWDAPYDSNNVMASITPVFDAAAKASGKRIGGDKTPNDLYFAHFLRSRNVFAYPETRVIHIVRDVRDIYLSLQAAGWSYGAEDGVNASVLATSWSSPNLEAAAIQRNYLRIRYEDLVIQPEPTLRAVCNHIGVSYTPRMLSSTTKNSKLVGLLEGLAHHQRLDHEIDPRNAFKWMGADISDDVKQNLASEAKSALTAFGYEL